MLLLIAVAVAACCLASAVVGVVDAYQSFDVVVQNLKLFVGGQEFIIKGMAYQPVPLGQNTPNGGFCSIKETVFGEYKTACFGSDYFDGSPADANRVPPGPTDSSGRPLPWWLTVWTRDLPRIAAMGANTVRIYNMNPFTKHYLQNKGAARYPGSIAAYGAQHRLFLDYCYRNGLKVIYPLVTDQTMLQSMSTDQLDEIIEDIIDEIGDHPALLMFQVGNELPLTTNPSLLSNVIARISKAKAYLKSKWNRVLPVTTAVVDDPQTYPALVQSLTGTADIFISNAGYRFTSFQPLWDGETGSPGWTQLSKQSGMPLLIGEFGMMNQTGTTQAFPDWPNQQWQQIMNNNKNGGIGGVFFEWSDEPTKDDPSQRDMGVVRYVEAFDSNGIGSTQPNCWTPDRIMEKPVVFDALSTGSTGSKSAQYNFMADPFTLLGRSAATIAGFPQPQPHPSLSGLPQGPAASLPGVSPTGSGGHSDYINSASPVPAQSALISSLRTAAAAVLTGAAGLLAALI